MSRAAAIPAAQRRLHAVQALLELAEQVAPDQISTAAIAERMGVSHGALFRHFPTREALWTEAVEWATGKLQGILDEVVEELADSPLETIEAMLTTYARFYLEHPGLLRMQFAELQRPCSSPARQECKRFMAGFRQQIRDFIESAQSSGELDSAQDSAELTGLLVAASQGLMLQGLVYGESEERIRSLQSGLRLILSRTTARVPG